MLVVFLMIYANTGVVNGENTEQEDAVNKGRIEEKITNVEDSYEVFLISILNAEGKEGGENDDECHDDTDCSNRDSENTDTEEIQSSTEILLPFP